MFAADCLRVRSVVVLVFLTCTGAVLGQWQPGAKLLPADAAPDMQFGNAVALGDGWVALGARFDGDAGREAGAVYILVGSESGWYEEGKLIASDAAPRAEFGAALALHNDLLLVGAPGSNAAEKSSGCAYVFRRAPGGWVEEAQLTASDAGRSDGFGSAVAAGSDWLLVGAPFKDTTGRDAGAAFVYRHDGTTWVEAGQLTGSQVMRGDEFGASVALDGSVAIVGAPRGGAGAAYVFRHDGSNWVEESVLAGSDGSKDDRFGASAALCDGAALLGAPRYDSPAGVNIGAVYVFRFEDGDWSEADRLTASDAAPADYFGVAVAMCAERAVVGAHFADDGEVNTGAAYVFSPATTEWVEEGKLTASDGAVFDMFGAAVAIDGERVVAGAPGDDDGGDGCGSAYVFAFEAQNEPPVCNAGGDQTIECAPGSVSVVLDGTGSFDPDEDALSYRWTTDCPIASLDDPNGATAVLTLVTGSACLTECDVTLTVSDGVNPPVSCQAVVTVVDSLPPVLTCPGEADWHAGDPEPLEWPEVEDCDPNVELSYSDSEVVSECAADPVSRTIARTWTATDWCGNVASCTQVITVWRLVLPLDIKPGSCENPHNARSNGFLPVALLGTPEVDAGQIAVDSLRLVRADCEGAPVAPNEGPPGPKVQSTDVGTPVSQWPCECHLDEADGIRDVMMKFPSELLEEALLLSEVEADVPLEVVLTGTINSPGSPLDGAEFIAVDCLRLVGQERKHRRHGGRE